MKFTRCTKNLAMAAALLLPAVILSTVAAPAAHAGVFVGVSIGIAPPVLPVYTQPICPGPGYLWTPGYWAYGGEGYFWVPGVWVQPPSVGLLWTPAWWGYDGGLYRFHSGYWGPQVGFYGGINYGFGYGGVGFGGGEWRGGSFFYNRAVANVNVVNIHNVYENRTIVNNYNHTTVSYNGGRGGIEARPTAQQTAYMNGTHVGPTANQFQHQQLAMNTPGQRFAENRGNPSVRAAASNAAFAAHPGDAQLARQPMVNQREGNQDQRIANGLRSGQMTSGEAARAEQRQSNIDQQVRNDRQANGGYLTQGERNQVNREQNNTSRQIYNDNHNASTIGPNNINNREANQEQRIANGQRSGQMTSGEAARAQQRQANIGAQTHADRTTGNLNGQQQRQINREQDRAGGQVRQENHNGDRGRR